MNIKRLLASVALGGIVLGSLAGPALADTPTDPGTYGTAAPNAQCGTAAMSGAFNFQNQIYGPNSSQFGLAGGSGGGQTGINNSTVCGNR